MLNLGYLKGQYLDLHFSIFALLFDGIDIGLVDYTMAQPHMYMFLEIKKVIKLLEENIDKLFDWFLDNFWKPNPDKCHLLVNTGESFKLKSKN